MRTIKPPSLLAEIYDPPHELFIKGEELPSQKTNIYLTVVGARKASPYGKQVVDYLIRGLAGYPFVIVSGLAIGIDSFAHEAALANHLSTIAIPGSGLNDNVLYPASNRGLAQRILESGGTLLSPFSPQTKATKWSFPQRNQIMAGISHGILVIEAENKSGSRITARLGLEYNREVFAVPGSIFNLYSSGTNQLLREGAFPITSAEDILEHFGFKPKNQGFRKKTPLEPMEQAVVDTLTVPHSKDDLARALGCSVLEISVALSGLELKELTEEKLGLVYLREW